MRPKRIILWLGGTLALLAGLAFGSYHFILDWQGRLYCHKQIMFAFHLWMLDQGLDSDSNTNSFPNVNGVGRDSLATIRDYMNGYGDMDWAKGYRYVPGLRQNDPGDLVLLYLDRPTRWTRHGAPGTIFRKKAWMIVPVDFTIGGRSQTGVGELSERVSLTEFHRRLNRTLDFIRTNERPNWQTIVAEQTTFLNSIQHVAR